MDTYKRVFGLMTKRTADKPKQVITRVLDNQIVGAPLDKPAAGTPEVDPAICDHPANRMKGRSNLDEKKGKGMKWWTCDKCKQRWERLDLTKLAETETPQDDDLVRFGKHQGRTYLEILTEFPQYAQWVIDTTMTETDECSPGLTHLANYLKPRMTTQMDDEELQYPEEWEEVST